MAPKKRVLVAAKGCPWCNAAPAVERWHNARNGYHIGCVNEECAVSPGFADRGLDHTVQLWNKREYDLRSEGLALVEVGGER